MRGSALRTTSPVPHRAGCETSGVAKVIEINDPAGAKVFQDYWDATPFAANQTITLQTAWQVPDDEPLNLGLLLYIPYRAMESRIFAALAEAGFDDFTPAQALYRLTEKVVTGRIA